LDNQLAAIGPVSHGSVAFQAPGSWRWTFKVEGKTACVALSKEQATQMLQAVENHKQVEEIVREMREITQTSILETVPGNQRKNLPMARDFPTTHSPVTLLLALARSRHIFGHRVS
jgi:hypothetical protein